MVKVRGMFPRAMKCAAVVATVAYCTPAVLVAATPDGVRGHPKACLNGGAGWKQSALTRLIVLAQLGLALVAGQIAPSAASAVQSTADLRRGSGVNVSEDLAVVDDYSLLTKFLLEKHGEDEARRRLRRSGSGSSSSSSSRGRRRSKRSSGGGGGSMSWQGWLILVAVIIAGVTAKYFWLRKCGENQVHPAPDENEGL